MKSATAIGFPFLLRFAYAPAGGNERDRGECLHGLPERPAYGNRPNPKNQCPHPRASTLGQRDVHFHINRGEDNKPLFRNRWGNPNAAISPHRPSGGDVSTSWVVLIASDPCFLSLFDVDPIPRSAFAICNRLNCLPSAVDRLYTRPPTSDFEN